MYNFNWRNNFFCRDVNNACDRLVLEFTIIYKRCFLHRHITKSKIVWKPWICRELMDKINIKNKLFKKFVRNMDFETFTVYEAYRNKRELWSAKKTCYNSLFSCVIVKRAGLLCKTLNNILNLNHKRQTIELTINGTNYSGKKLANAFTSYLVNLVGKSSHSNVQDAPQHMQTTAPESIFMLLCTHTEIISTFIDLISSNTIDINGIRIKPVKLEIDLLAILVNILNTAID